jgi:hypothetical protein
MTSKWHRENTARHRTAKMRWSAHVHLLSNLPERQMGLVGGRVGALQDEAKAKGPSAALFCQPQSRFNAPF